MTEYNRSFYDRRAEGSRRSAKRILPLVVEWLTPKTAVDVGCGSGEWLRALSELGVSSLTGVDGSPAATAAGHNIKILTRDLSTPLRLEGRFDLAVSVEVAEHLPLDRAAGFVADLCSLSDVVLFSAAIPQQGGVHHINEQWPDYWFALFSAHGRLPYDCLRRRLWDEQEIDWWYAQNLFLFAPPNHPVLTSEVQPLPPRLPHPRHYLIKASESRPENMSLSSYLKAGPAVLRGFFARHTR